MQLTFNKYLGNHSGIEHNDTVDSMAKEAAQQVVDWVENILHCSMCQDPYIVIAG